MRKIYYYIFVLFIIFSCQSNTNKKVTNTNILATTIDTTLFKGAWQYCNQFGDYQLMEFANDDSGFKYIEHEHYTGPTFPFRYRIVGDSLFLDSDETSSKNRWLVQKIDTASMWLLDEYDTLICKKVKLEFNLHDNYPLEQQNIHGQFLSLKKKYDCGK